MWDKVKSFNLFPSIGEQQERTLAGGILSLITFVLVFILVVAHFTSYMSVHVETDLTVDSSRGQPLNIYFDITFPGLPCSVLSVDATNIAGEEQVDISASVFKQRLDAKGKTISEAEAEKLKSKYEQVEKVNVPMNGNGCSSCYGAESEQFQCCETCEDVRAAYRERGWAFTAARSVPQCINEGYSDNLVSQKYEGCNVYGSLDVKKIGGSFHISPGQSMKGAHSHVHDSSTYSFLDRINFSHTINTLSFGKPFPGQKNLLDGTSRTTEDKSSMFQYFVKVVSSQYTSLDQTTLATNQYSVTQHYQPIDNTVANHDSHGEPGVFFVYDISPIQVHITERADTFAAFIINLCAIVGGIYTLFSVVDQFVHQGVRSIKHKNEIGKIS